MTVKGDKEHETETQRTWTYDRWEVLSCDGLPAREGREGRTELLDESSGVPDQDTTYGWVIPVAWDCGE